MNIPLSSLEEKGSWDDNTWYNSQGKFPWPGIDRSEISVEDAGTVGKQIWFDNIHKIINAAISRLKL